MPDLSDVLIALGIAILAGIGVTAWALCAAADDGRAAEFAGEEPAHHEGATEGWSPAAELEAVPDLPLRFSGLVAPKTDTLEGLVHDTFDGLVRVADVLGYDRLDLNDELVAQLGELLATGRRGQR